MNYISKNFDELTTKELYEILKSRAKIFVEEQNMNYVDMDDTDYISRHFFLEQNGEIVAYLRAFCYGKENDTLKIGRVLSIQHGIGLGSKLMNLVIDEMHKNNMCKKIVVSAQKHAEGFYRQFGFEAVSDEYYEEEGLLHIFMEKRIN